jgi:hypothetical protein
MGRRRWRHVNNAAMIGVLGGVHLGRVHATETAMRFGAILLCAMWTSLAPAQTLGGQSLADAATFGAVATLAPLCGLRDEAWSADLRRAARQTATGSAATDDAALSRAPGGNQAAAALGYGDMEALEDFAADTPEVSCAALRKNPALDPADKAVDAFRRRRDGKPVG